MSWCSVVDQAIESAVELGLACVLRWLEDLRVQESSLVRSFARITICFCPWRLSWKTFLVLSIASLCRIFEFIEDSAVILGVRRWLVLDLYWLDFDARTHFLTVGTHCYFCTEFLIHQGLQHGRLFRIVTLLGLDELEFYGLLFVVYHNRVSFEGSWQACRGT